jgi:putative phage-type endonuclease
MIAQGSPEWHEQRRGRVTGSRIHCLIASGNGAGRKSYMRELLLERLTGKVAEGFRSAAMDRGTELEADAVRAYEFFHDQTSIEVGFVTHPTLDLAGASPDRLVGHDGVVEVKCPLGPAHLDFLEGKSIKPEYVSQMQWEMACTGRAWCDFVSFNPDFPEAMRLRVVRVQRDEAHIRKLEAATRSFLEELSIEVDKLRFRYEGAQAA